MLVERRVRKGRGKTGATGLEPATSAVTGQRSNQLSYAPALAHGILLTCVAQSIAGQLWLPHDHPKLASQPNDCQVI
jgi:hypothetical protein